MCAMYKRILVQKIHSIIRCYTLHMSWGPENHSMPPPGVRPPFLNHKLYKEMDFGVKPISFRSSLLNSDCFKRIFSASKIIAKNWFLLLIFEFLYQYICINMTSFLKFDCRNVENCWILSHVTLFLKVSCFIAITAII